LHRKCGRVKQNAVKDYDLKDLHRPYLDEIKLKCECGKEMTRIKVYLIVGLNQDQCLMLNGIIL
jgi:isoleucyl-tRNA synthetase